MTAGTTYRFDLETPQFRAYLRLEDGQDRVVAEDDDSNRPDLSARLVFTAPAAGAYRIVASSYRQRGAGIYTLTVREFAALNTDRASPIDAIREAGSRPAQRGAAVDSRPTGWDTEGRAPSTWATRP